jgi:membrane protease YdiL (CAAX protease family)
MSSLASSGEVRDSVILFLLLTGLLQVFWFVSTRFNLFVKYYPLGFIVHVLVYLSELALLCVYVKALRKGSFYQLGFGKVRRWKAYVAVGFVLAVFHNTISFTVSATLIGLKYGYILPFYVHVPLYFAFALLMSISEEGIFRGCILGQLSRRYDVTKATVISSTFFGLYHIYYIPLLFPGDALETLFQASYAFHSFTAGLFLAYFYHKTGGNILGPITYHFCSIFFNIPFLWTEVTPIAKIGAQQLSSGLILIQILILKLAGKAFQTSTFEARNAD